MAPVERRPRLVLHDRFQVKGGGERVAMDFAAALDAAIVTEYWDRDASYPVDDAIVPITPLGRKVRMRGMWYLAPCVRFWRFGRQMRGQDVVLFSGSSCLAAARRGSGALKIHYCYSPPRFAFDQREFLAVRQHLLVRPIFRLFAAAVRLWYRRQLRKVDIILTVSKTVQERLLRLCGQDSQVLYPGISAPSVEPANGEYYLSFARIDPLKRVEQIVEAFVEMPELQLVVVSSGSREARIRELASNAPNIIVVGSVTDEELQQAIARCIAVVYIPIQEDFGLTPLEAAALGKPTIGVAEGGLRETILDGCTGVLLPPDFDRSQLIAAVRGLDRMRAEQMKAACLAQAERFSKARFLSNLQNLLAREKHVEADDRQARPQAAEHKPSAT